MRLARIAALVAVLLLSSSMALAAGTKATAKSLKKHHRHTTAAMVHGKHHKTHAHAAKHKGLAKAHTARTGHTRVASARV
jgi:hypothetical protein